MSMLRACRAMRFGLEAKSEEDLSTAVNDDNDDNDDDDGILATACAGPVRSQPCRVGFDDSISMVSGRVRSNLLQRLSLICLVSCKD